jgi:hypothetical protein|tara:strand:+ start:8186 stop:9022 length:837 start_codon:yes stop_codon:yes gene_type:complete
MPLTSTCGADTLGENLYDTLGEGSSYVLPAVDWTDAKFDLPSQTDNPLYADVNSLTNADLTTQSVGGDGSFDAIMSSIKAHLKDEYEEGRLTGADYAKAYTELTGGAMSAGVQFLLGREQSYWNGVLVQAQARKAETESVLAIVQLEIGKATLVTTQHQAKAAEGQVALLKMQLASEDAKYCLTSEQVESKRADTSNTRTDGTPIVGTAGKQKELYTQQIDSYQKDSSFKIAKLFSDSWTVQKTLNENLEAPDNFLNAEVDKVMNSIREGSGLGTPAP